ncbi:MAG: S41 family peptidase [Leptospiraceae bacterium]
MFNSTDQKENGARKDSFMKKNERFFWMGTVLILLSGYLLQPLYSEKPALSDRYRMTLEILLQSIKENYVEDVDEETLLLGAIRGMLAATGDPYTRFLDPQENSDFSRSEGGALVGIGVEVTMCQNVPCVIAPMDGSPAARAGIQPGDRIIEIDGVSTERKEFAEILRIMTGETGSVVQLKVIREDMLEPLEFSITRQIVEVDYCRGKILPGNIGYIRLSQFFGEDTGTVETFRNWVQTFDEKKVKGVVLDLRNNSGGHLEMAVTLASMFLPADKVVVKASGRNEDQDNVFLSRKLDTRLSEGIPVVVLINEGSASASEILAGALQDHKRAVLLGETSFGKGSVQNIFRPLPGNTAALITTQKYFTPANRSIHGVGLKPDIPVPSWDPTMEDRYHAHKIRSAGILEQFVKSNSHFNSAAVQKFRKLVQSKGYPLSEKAALTLLRSQYPASPFPERELDFQLDRAMNWIEARK